MTEKLFTPVALGDLTLPNRVVMSPLTRNRARPDGDVPQEMNAEYYAQRAGAGLIITEATQISPEGKGYAWTPGIYSEEQVEGWKLVTDAVHRKGGRIAAQIWHVGRISHTSLQPDGQAPVAPSAIAAKSRTFDGESFVETSTPRALETDEIPRLVEDFRKAAENAKKAGFDAVEIHGANGYLIDQFLRDSSNKRTDQYGGSVENRTRLLKEVVEAVTSVWDPKKVGIRFGPYSNANDVSDSDPLALFSRAYDIAEEAGLGFLDIIEGQTGGERDAPEDGLAELRKHFSGLYIANNGYTRELAIERVEAGKADAVAFGRPYISNPDLVERLKQDAPLNELDKENLYGGREKGYTDYPTLEEQKTGA
ncbi:alkene reductase [Henriciella aquimarina]|uniref:alkene reductase n=1 Tax=Henriciella aquimarina TaxID=545261 RepID=UPI0009FEB9F8|nr:alkene reductase [Henriciella aquimarina]